MSWLRLEDNMLDHPKWRRAVRKGGDGTVAVWVRLVSWCSRNLTDGVIPADMLEEVADVERARDLRKALDGLVFGSLLVVDGSGNGRVVDYLERNPSREQVLAARERRTQGQRNRRGSSSVTELHSATEAERDSAPIPIPSQSQIPLKPPQHASTVPKGSEVTPPAGASTPADARGPGSESSTHPEEPKPKRSKRARRPSAPEVAMPVDWAPSAAHRAYAAKHGLNLEREADAMRGWAEGRTALSWNGTFTTRLANAAKWRAEKLGPVSTANANVDVDLSSEAAWLR